MTVTLMVVMILVRSNGRENKNHSFLKSSWPANSKYILQDDTIYLIYFFFCHFQGIKLWNQQIFESNC